MNPDKMQLKVLIADDHPIVRQGLRMVIEREADLQVVAEAGNGRETLDKIKQHQPDVVLLDVDMPLLDGFQVAEALRESQCHLAVIFLTVHREEGFLKKALDLGAKGYVLKDSAVTDIVNGIRAVQLGQTYVSPALVSYLVNRRTSSGVVGLDSLTSAERRVLRMIAQYKTTKEIAAALFISPRTVESHRTNICQKLNLRGSHSLMRFALAHLPEIESD
ncbi:MAG TPA: response regulator transcription factor [Blastocatellia bacterium]|nr:response regulator transcription factor [Blastocatellia bacterium]HMV84206.1 response regulator transcription factor [Blastocatellia bacterium]HMX28092.1 response regulator transcription factor [Blastocatellia bacterium]HMY75663.1 response regulator transcription factor [Blastocatellia bacterium]HMZ22144.1 response regulator transcription factor [Blastocatellia bacterium]